MPWPPRRVMSSRCWVLVILNGKCIVDGIIYIRYVKIGIFEPGKY